jgi:PAS domain S-box-containing protein
VQGISGAVRWFAFLTAAPGAAPAQSACPISARKESMEASPTPSVSAHRKLVGRLLLRAVMLPAILLTAVTLILLGEVRYLVHSLQWVDTTDEVIAQIDDLQRLFIDMETGLRGYAATGNQELLEPYKESEQRVSDKFDWLAHQASENPEQTQRIAALRSRFLVWIQYSRHMLRALQAENRLDPVPLARQLLSGKQLMDDIRRQVGDLSAAENRLRDIRVKQARNTEYIVVATTGLLFLAGCATLALRTRRQIHHIIEEQALRATNELLETLVKNAPVGLVMFDRDMRYIRASERWLKDVGLSGEGLIGRSHYEDFPNLGQHLKDAHRRGLAGQSVSGDGEWFNAKGEYHTGNWTIQPYGEPGAPARGIIMVTEDTTERTLAEKALQDSEHKLRLLAGSLLTAQEDERRSLARELHDDITQQLAFLSVELGRLAGDLPDSDTHVRPRVQNLQNQALRASDHVRRLSHGLHPSVITDFGLSVALQELCEQFERVHGLAIEFEEIIEDSRLTDSQASCLYRVAQESMRNAVQHGKATELKLTLSLAGDFIELKLMDNGIGFNDDQIRQKPGLGIISMTERVRLAGGTLSLASTEGHGTVVSASLPVSAPLPIGGMDESHENNPGR